MSECSEQIDLGAVLQMAVLFPVDVCKGLFRVVGKVPSWWSTELGAINSQGFCTIESPFLAGFLEEATEIWNAEQDAVHMSPFFELSNRSPLQALAIREHGKSMLVIRDLKVIDHWIADVLRKSRRHMVRQEYERSSHRREVADVVADRDEAQRRDELKSRVLATVSHEIRTPLTTILGMADLARHDPAGSEKQLIAISAAANQLLDMGRDLLDLSKMQVERLELDSQPLDLNAFVDSLEQVWSMHAAKKGLAFSVHRDSLPTIVLADEFRLRQAVENMLGNAIKYTESGDVQLSVTSLPVAAIRFEVTDTGCGISEEDLPHIFEEFSQVDPSKRIRHQGAGLGMAIASRLVRLMGGEILVESTFGEGTRFWFDIALESDSNGNETTVDQSAALRLDQPANILVAEDHALNRSLIVDIVERAGGSTVEACNGREAVELWQSASVDAILMDCQMPIMNGLDAIREIRQTEKKTPAGAIPIVALTAHAMKGDVDLMVTEGADVCVTKPCEAQNLVSVLNKLLKRK